MSSFSTPAEPNAALIEAFYSAFARRDAEAMAACYHPEVEFSDPVFPDLQGEAAGDMWRMLCARGKDLRIEASGVEADAAAGRAHWEARYTFSATGRQVHNRIDARFEFEAGKIRRHVDSFDLWAWAGQALGLKGKLLGWSPLVQKAIRAQAAKGLQSFRAGRASPS